MILTVLTLLASIIPLAYGQAVTACVTAPPITLNRVSVNGALAGCVSSCAANLLAPLTGYAYYNPTNGNCYCTLVAPTLASNTFGTATTSGGVCAASNPYQVVDLRTTFALNLCAATSDGTSVFTGPTQNILGVASPDACFTGCNGYPGVAITPEVGNLLFDCTCTNGFTSATSAICGTTGSRIFYTHTVTPQPSTRRRRATPRDVTLCPAGKQACIVGDGDSHAWECIDTRSELESCGGCMFGDYGNSTSATGTDCSRIPNVALGAATCLNGECRISACKAGYFLSDNTCLPFDFKAQSIRRKRRAQASAVARYMKTKRAEI